MAHVQGRHGEVGEVAMTGAEFERLLYTDCPPGAGRGAGGGFQVQAQSPAVDSAQSALAVGWLLYEAQNAWIAQRRPVEDFPLGLAHASGAGYGTSQGRYVGKEATGGRQGNHLTDCLLTRNPALYGTTAGLGAVAIRAVAGGTLGLDRVPALEGAPEPGPLTLDSVTAWLRLLRRMNEALPDEIPEWFYTRHIKPTLAHDILGTRPRRTRLAVPAARQAWARGQAESLVTGLRDAKYSVVGDLGELLPPAGTGPPCRVT